MTFLSVCAPLIFLFLLIIAGIDWNDSISNVTISETIGCDTIYLFPGIFTYLLVGITIILLTIFRYFDFKHANMNVLTGSSVNIPIYYKILNIICLFLGVVAGTFMPFITIFCVPNDPENNDSWQLDIHILLATMTFLFVVIYHVIHTILSIKQYKIIQQLTQIDNQCKRRFEPYNYDYYCLCVIFQIIMTITDLTFFAWLAYDSANSVGYENDTPEWILACLLIVHYSLSCYYVLLRKKHALYNSSVI